MTFEATRAQCDFSAPGVTDTDWQDGTAWVVDATDRSPESQGGGTGSCLECSASLPTLVVGSNPAFGFFGPNAANQQPTIPQSTDFWTKTNNAVGLVYQRGDIVQGAIGGYGGLVFGPAFGVLIHGASNSLFAPPGVDPSVAEWQKFRLFSDDEGADVRARMEHLSGTLPGNMHCFDNRFNASSVPGLNGTPGRTQIGAFGIGSPGTLKLDTITHVGSAVPTFTQAHPTDVGGLSTPFDSANWVQDYGLYEAPASPAYPPFTIASTDFPLDPTGNHLSLDGANSVLVMTNQSRQLLALSRRLQEFFFRIPNIGGTLPNVIVSVSFYQQSLGGSGVIGYRCAFTISVNAGGSVTAIDWTLDQLLSSGTGGNVGSGTFSTVGALSQGDWIGLGVSADRRNISTLGAEFEVFGRGLPIVGPDTGWNSEGTPSDTGIAAGDLVFDSQLIGMASEMTFSTDATITGYAVRNANITETL